MIHSELSTEENLNQLFGRMDGLIEQIEATGQFGEPERRSAVAVIDDITYFVG